jgi:uroporphyrinogen decarboxylase
VNAREKFQAAMSFASPGFTMKTEFGYWAGAIRRWLSEGLPERAALPATVLDGDLVRGSLPLGSESPGCESGTWTRTGSAELVDRNVMPLLGLDSYLAKFPIDFSPRLPKRILEEDDHRRVFTDAYGLTVMVLKDGAATPEVLDYPIGNRRDLEEYLERYDAELVRELQAEVRVLAQGLEERTYPLRLGGGPFGFTFFLRSLMGEVGYMTALYDDPGLIHRFNEFFLNHAMVYWAAILEAVDIDCVMILEDVAYRSGPMISPEMFATFALPYTRRLVDFVRQFGVECIVVDCDGRIDALIPLWVRAGVTGIFPVEAANDILAIREAFPRLQLLGGIDKRPLIRGEPRAIDDELERIRPLLDRGGYVPHVDHAVPADVSWESFVYYRERLNQIIDARCGAGAGVKTSRRKR